MAIPKARPFNTRYTKSKQKMNNIRVSTPKINPPSEALNARQDDVALCHCHTTCGSLLVADPLGLLIL